MFFLKDECLWRSLSSFVPRKRFPAMNANVHYYNTKKYCPSCREYVRFLQSIDSSFCVECGSKVRLFSSADKAAFLDGLKRDKNRNTNPGSDQKRVS